MIKINYMKKNVDKISDGVFEIEERKKLFLSLRKKNSKILQYCNYILLKEKQENFKKKLLDKLKISHKKLSFSPLIPKKINTDREYHFKKNSFLNKTSFYHKNNGHGHKNLTLQKIRYNSANNNTIDKNKTINKSINNKRLILIPLGLKNYIKNKENENKTVKAKKFSRNIIFKNNNPFCVNLFKQNKNENDMIFPIKFQKLKK